jgi:hypothetical protein
LDSFAVLAKLLGGTALQNGKTANPQVV